MTIGPCTADDVQKAMQRFDLEMRDTLEWRQWEGDKNHKFAFVSNDHRHRSELSVHRELEIVGADNSAGMKRKDCSMTRSKSWPASGFQIGNKAESDIFPKP